MSKPAYLVEGDLEQKFIQNACPSAPVKKINCNGNQTSIDAIARRVGTLGRLLHKRYSPLIIVFDREGRDESSQDIEQAFIKALEKEKLEVPVIVGVPDRNIESWILSDFEMFLQAGNFQPTQGSAGTFEGINGKSAIKKLVGDGRSYVETIDGVSWLKACRPSVMRANSQSFARFFTALTGLECWWLNQLHLPLQENTASPET